MYLAVTGPSLCYNVLSIEFHNCLKERKDAKLLSCNKKVLIENKSAGLNTASAESQLN